MKIVFDPCESKTNRYIPIVVEALRHQGISVYNLTQFFWNVKLLFGVKIVHVNWFENIIGESDIAKAWSFLKQFFKLVILKLLGKRIVWTMHNKMSHDVSADSLSNLLTSLLIRWSSKIIIHSEISRDILLSRFRIKPEKIIYCPHPNYIGHYGEVDPKGAVPKEKDLKLLFIGAVKPYKNIEILIEVVRAFKNNVQLRVVGKVANEGYRNVLEELVKKTSNIALDFRFVKDDEMGTLIQQSDLVVLPYDIRSSLNSGTALLAFSYNRSVICPEIGTINDLRDLSKYTFSYSYSNDEEHRRALRSCVEQAIEAKGRQELFTYGKKLNEHVRKNHRIELVSEKLKAAYSFK